MSIILFPVFQTFSFRAKLHQNRRSVQDSLLYHTKRLKCLKNVYYFNFLQFGLNLRLLGTDPSPRDQRDAASQKQDGPDQIDPGRTRTAAGRQLRACFI